MQAQHQHALRFAERRAQRRRQAPKPFAAIHIQVHARFDRAAKHLHKSGGRGLRGHCSRRFAAQILDRRGAPAAPARRRRDRLAGLLAHQQFQVGAGQQHLGGDGQFGGALQHPLAQRFEAPAPGFIERRRRRRRELILGAVPRALDAGQQALTLAAQHRRRQHIQLGKLLAPPGQGFGDGDTGFVGQHPAARFIHLLGALLAPRIHFAQRGQGAPRQLAGGLQAPPALALALFKRLEYGAPLFQHPVHAALRLRALREQRPRAGQGQHVAGGVIELRRGQRPAQPVRARLALVQDHAEQRLHQRPVAQAKRLTEQRRRALGIDQRLGHDAEPVAKHRQIFTGRVQHFAPRGVGEQFANPVRITNGEGIDQPGPPARAELQQGHLGVVGVKAHKFRVHGDIRGVAQGVEGAPQPALVLYPRKRHADSTGWRPEKAWVSVEPSTYSSSPPRGTPCAMREIFGTRGSSIRVT